MNIRIILIRNYKFTSRLIHVGMWLYCVLRFKKPERTYNHLEIEIGDKTYGAIAMGVKERTIKEAAKLFGKHERKVYEFEVPEEFVTELNKLIGKKYQFRNFLQHAIDIFCDQWFGYRRKKALDRIYCCELGFYLLDYFGIIKNDYWKINPNQAKKLLDSKI